MNCRSEIWVAASAVAFRLLREALLVERRKPEEAVLPLGRDLIGRAVGAEEVVDVELVERDQPRHPARHLRVSGERPVLCPRQFDPGLDPGGDGRGRGDGACGQRENRNRRIHDHKR